MDATFYQKDPMTWMYASTGYNTAFNNMQNSFYILSFKETQG